MSEVEMEKKVKAIWPQQSDPYADLSPEQLQKLLTEVSDPPLIGSVACPVLKPEALHGIAGDVVRVIAPESEADPAAILIQFLIATGNMVGPAPHCTVEATRHGLNLFGCIVGETSKARKGTSWGHIKGICELLDHPWTRDRVTGGLSSAEGLIAEVADGGEIPRDRRLLAVQGEFASVLRVLNRDGNTLSPLLRSAWDSGDLRTLVKRDPQRASNAHISIIGHITRTELLRNLSDTDQHNGFANRILWVFARRSQCLPEGGRVSRSEIEAIADQLKLVMIWASTCGLIERDEQARELWRLAYPTLSAGHPGLLGAATARAEAQVLRLAALYAVLDRSRIVRIEHLQAALAVWDYCYSSASYIFGDATGDPVADRIREALREAATLGMTRTEIRDLFKRHESSDRIQQALNQLVELRIAGRRVVETEGRSIEMWTATEATNATKDSPGTAYVA
jgi:hypothetical protein